MKSRGPWQGMMTIARFNWPFYLAALAVFAAAVPCAFASGSPWLKAGAALAAAGSFYFLFVSLGVSHWIYDRSDLYRWHWLKRALGDGPKERMVFCHAGFDEASEMLEKELGTARWHILDHHDEDRMSEPSIRRARALFPPVAGTLAAPHDRWPLDPDHADAIFGLLAIHELRTPEERTAWFAEARRCLKRHGRIVLVEHVRDFANFLAFGPGFMHFHSCAAWRRSWEAAGLRLADEFRITPFVRVFIIMDHG